VFMRSSFWREVFLVSGLLVFLTALIALSGADLAVSSFFFIKGAWPVGDRFPWKLLYQIDRLPAVLLAVAGLLAAAASLRWPSWRQWARSGVFLALLLALGPGLLVNTIFKEGWGRPRPREVLQFEGKKIFLHPWQKGISGQGRSFPSGHASAAFYMMSPFFIYRHKNKKRAHAWLAGGVVFGIFMSIARISQGGHFLSDTLWSFGMVYLTALFLAALLKLDQMPTAPTFPAQKSCST
jgi:membrane-associated PAP2 superfamily phosphatase